MNTWFPLATLAVSIYLATFLITWGLPASAAPKPSSERRTTKGGADKTETVDALPAAEDGKSEGTPGDIQSDLPTLEQLESDFPSVARLIAGPPLDWLVLHTDRVIQVFPLSPRPNTLEKMQAAIKANFKNLPAASKKGSEATAQHLALYFLPLQLATGDEEGEDFRIHLKHIKQILHYEDLILRRIDRSLDEQHTADAFDLLAALRELDANWPGIDQRQDRLLFVEAAVRTKQHALEEALGFLEELHTRNAGFEGLTIQLAAVGGKLIDTAIASQDYRRARHFLARLRKRISTHKAVAERTEALLTLATERLQEALAAEKQGAPDVAALRAELATRIWPNTPGLHDQYLRLANRFQTLRVGVLELPAPRARQLVPSRATFRQRQLGPTPLFEPARLDGKLVRYQSRFFEEWEPTDLGRSILFRLKQRLPTWEPRAFVSSGRIVDALALRMDPHNPAYDERFSSAVASVTYRTPFEFEVDFARIPLRPELLFTFAAGAAAEDVSSSFSLAALPAGGDGTAEDSVPAAFPVYEQTPEHVTYRRALAEPTSNSGMHVAEIVERKYASHEKAIQGLLRGEVTLLPHVPAGEVARLKKLKSYFVHSYALPLTHVLQFHPHNPVLANRTLRRAMVFALDRQQILEKTILGAHDDKDDSLPGKTKQRNLPGKLTSAPFPSNAIGYDASIRPHKFDLTLAMTMCLAAKKELGAEFPPLRLHCPNDPIIHVAARQLIQQWEQIGLKVSLEGDTADLSNNLSGEKPAWDILYRTVSLAAPIADLWPFLTLDENAKVDSLAQLPNWLRQELIALEQAGDWTAAEQLLMNLHKQLWAEVTVIPLWEVSDFFVLRNSIQYVPTRPIFTYQGVERWRVQPWYPRETP